MEDSVEIKETNTTTESVEEKPSQNETVNKENDKGFFKYYLFILLNSIIGFIVVLYLSKYLIELLATKNIIDLRNVKTIPSVVIATVVTMLFMMITLVFKKFFRKLLFSEIILYIYIGGLTTIINIVAWNFFFKLISGFIVSEQIAWKVAEVIAFVVAVIFAFLADKIVVFKSYSFRPGKVFTELGIFISARIITELINVGIMMFLIDYQKNDPLFGKIVASVVVVILNYLFSKFIIFRKKEIKHEEHNQ